MKAFENRVAKLESSIGRKDEPLLLISLKREQSKEEAVAMFYEQHPNSRGLLIILNKVFN